MPTEFGIKVKFDLDKKQTRQLKETTKVQKDLADSYKTLSSSMKSVGVGAAAGIGSSFILANKSVDGFVGSLLKVNAVTAKMGAVLAKESKYHFEFTQQMKELKGLAKELHDTTFDQLKGEMALTKEMEKQNKESEKRKKTKEETPYEKLFLPHKGQLGGAAKFAAGGGMVKAIKGTFKGIGKGIGFGKALVTGETNITESLFGMGKRGAKKLSFKNQLETLGNLKKGFTNSLKGMGDATGGFAKKLLSSKAAALGLLGGLIAVGSFSPLLQSELAFSSVYLEQFSMIIGDSVAPVVGLFTDGLKFLLEAYQGLSPEMKASIGTLVTLATALAAAAVGAWGVSLAMSALSLPIIGVAVAVFALVVAFEHNFLGMKDSIMGFIDMLLGGFTSISEGIEKIFSGDWVGGLQDIWTGFVDIAYAAIFGIPSIVGDMIAELFIELGKLTEGIPFLSDLFTAIGDILGNLIGGAADIITGILTLNFGLVEQGWAKVQGKYVEHESNVQGSMSGGSFAGRTLDNSNTSTTNNNGGNTIIIISDDPDAEDEESVEEKMKERGIVF